MWTIWNALVLTVCAFFFSSISFANEPHLPLAAQQVMQQERYQHAQWWIVLKDLQEDKMIYDLHSQFMLMPASTTKLFTTASALHYLGYDYRFKTPVYFIGNQHGDTLRGNLILVGQGDFLLGSQTKGNQVLYTYIDHIYANVLPGATLVDVNPLNGLQQIAKQIAQRGIKKLIGSVLIDDRYFHQTVERDYTLSSVMVNENLIDIQIKPNALHQLATINWQPKVAGYEIVNQVQTVANNEATQISIHKDKNKDIYYVTGQIPLNSPQILRIAYVEDPNKFAQGAFIAALNEQGIEVIPTAEKNTLPSPDAYKKLSPLAQYISPPLTEYVKLILKVSHNIGADTLALILAAQHQKKNFNEGLPYIAAFLTKQVHLNPNLFVFADAAGGDGNRLSPLASIELLSYLAKNLSPKDFHAFYTALPILGVDGSIAKNNMDSPAKGHVFGKTGTSISYDNANQRFYSFAEVLSGYMMPTQNPRYAFMIAVSNTPMVSIDDAFLIQKDVSNVAAAIYLDLINKENNKMTKPN